ncbi:MAG: energy-coupling factor ABC transporter ATP-binding protein [Atopobiaceae bacterium]|jgi:cobalt/nickel transport system ATP-binding protein|nr:energy-coupling factor ABC transporter ATP-binding protein [Atopobiaceae bacterium]MCI2173585.1 energy-coupling factor ABC transporter ATP-binding protein [Atopobiaceae bacterium]MCI2207773.1 energy-coupling factor ABC transporter ATP-binding protein [Atopobiaceae bacterium]
MSEPEPVVLLDHVSFSYGEASLALDDVSFEVAPGEAVALLGPNGCGKSTALRVLNGLEFARSGSVEVLGRRVDRELMSDQLAAKAFHQQVGFVFQNADTQLFCPSVGEEVAFGPRQMGLSETEVKRRVADVMDVFDIAHLADRAPYHLSGGERHKVAIACVVSMAPRLLVLDEPTSGLDEESEDVVEGFLRSFVAAGRSVLVTTHHPCLVDAIGARVVRMDKDHRVVS